MMWVIVEVISCKCNIVGLFLCSFHAQIILSKKLVLSQSNNTRSDKKKVTKIVKFLKILNTKIRFVSRWMLGGNGDLVGPCREPTPTSSYSLLDIPVK